MLITAPNAPNQAGVVARFISQMNKTAASGTFSVKASELTRRFGDLTAVDHVDLRVPYGEIFGLLGANGAGKSTLIKMLTTLLPPTSGNAEVGGFDIIRSPAQVRGRIGYVPQLLSADGALTGHENLLLSAKLYGLSRAQRSVRIGEALDFMGLADSARKLVKTYSGGMVRRLELAQAMLHRPAILFLDEPTIGLDPMARHSVWDRLRDLRRDYGMTVLITTHDMDEAEALCDELAILHTGQVAVVGKPAELRAGLGASATMDDVFAHYAGGGIREGGNFSDAVQTRRTAQRLG
jgi:ABC-2 type transport system ATP-binding protein